MGMEMRPLEDEELYQHQITTGQDFSRLLSNYMKGAGKLKDNIITTSGRSKSMHKTNIQKMWTTAQAISKGKNMNNWIKNNE